MTLHSPTAVTQGAQAAVHNGAARVAVPDAEVVRPRRIPRSHAHRLMLVADGVGAALAAGVSVTALSWDRPTGGVAHRVVLVAFVFSALAGVLAVRGARHGQIAPRVADDLGFIVSSVSIAGLCLFAVRSVPALGVSIRPSSIGVAMAAAAVSIPLAREVGIVLAARNPANVSRVVVVGSGFIAGYLTARLSRSPLVQVLGIVDDRPHTDQRVLGRFEDLPRLCEALRVDRVVIAFSERHPARTADVIHLLRSRVEVDVVVRFFEVTGWDSRLTDVTGLPLLSLGAPPGRLGRAVKRAMDISVSSLTLGLLSPLLLAVALAVRLESGAPVLFRQERVGRTQRIFRILKFRTMRPAASEPLPATSTRRRAGTAFTVLRSVGRGDGTRFERGRQDHPETVRTPFDTVPDPARITRIGSVLRRTGIDELPQLINVLRGEMSLVGPRPFIPEECDALSGPVARRFAVRPGMTGMWQVCGQHELTFEELVRLDVQYATSWSLRSDLRILARTPGRLLRGSAPGR